jgi:hypothetical protein
MINGFINLNKNPVYEFFVKTHEETIKWNIARIDHSADVLFIFKYK